MTQQPTTATPQQGQQAAWTCTGVSWRGGRPALTMIDANGRELSHPLRHGEPFGLRTTGPRHCIGLWRGDTRSCPFDALIAATGSSSQCDACAAADPGRALARDTTIDHRNFRLYLANFGVDTFKVGISAHERGNERLLEQGALAFTWIGEGSHRVIRATENAIADAGLAPERRRRATKIAGWHNADDPAQRRDALVKVATTAQELSSWPMLAKPTPVEVVDHADLFGLAELPDHLDDVNELGPGATLTGQIRSVIGTELVLDQPTANGTRGLLLSGRMLAGWPITPVTGEPGDSPIGYRTQPVQAPAGQDAVSEHPVLF